MWVSHAPKTSVFQQIIYPYPHPTLWMITYTRRYTQSYPQIIPATHWVNCTTAANGNALDAEYNLSNTNLVCSFWMRWNH